MFLFGIKFFLSQRSLGALCLKATYLLFFFLWVLDLKGVIAPFGRKESRQ